MNEITIRRAAPGDEAGMSNLLDVVAREEIYIGLLVGPTPDQVLEHWNQPSQSDNVLLLAFHDEKVVGWVNVKPRSLEIFRHTAGLGIGLLPEYRDRGLGTRLMNEAIETAWSMGLERIDLRVYASNERAIRLYEKVGFVTEGIERRGRYLHGEWFDLAEMALLNPAHLAN
jgi:RimJ/RimL family protein N-acetyltransferase